MAAASARHCRRWCCLPWRLPSCRRRSWRASSAQPCSTCWAKTSCARRGPRAPRRRACCGATSCATPWSRCSRSWVCSSPTCSPARSSSRTCSPCPASAGSSSRRSPTATCWSFATSSCCSRRPSSSSTSRSTCSTLPSIRACAHAADEPCRTAPALSPGELHDRRNPRRGARRAGAALVRVDAALGDRARHPAQAAAALVEPLARHRQPRPRHRLAAHRRQPRLDRGGPRRRRHRHRLRRRPRPRRGREARLGRGGGDALRRLHLRLPRAALGDHAHGHLRARARHLDRRHRHLQRAGVRAHHAGQRPRRALARVRARGARTRQGRVAHHARARAAEHHADPHRPGDDPVRARHPRRGGTQLPRPGHAAADAFVGPHAQRGAAATLPGAAARRLSRRRHRADRPRPQPDGRRLARHLRSAAGASALKKSLPPLGSSTNSSGLDSMGASGSAAFAMPVRRALVTLLVAFLTACGGSDGGSTPLPATLVLSVPATRQALGVTISFASNTSEPALSYRWDFGDGTTSTLVAPTHAYSMAGVYTVRLTLSNDSGGSISTADTVTIADFAIVAGKACSGPGSSGWCWQRPLPQGNYIADYAFIDDTRGWAVGDGGTILATVDAGVTWNAQMSGTQLFVGQVKFASALTGWAASSNGELLK